jgi:hypothetical protein
MFVDATFKVSNILRYGKRKIINTVLERTILDPFVRNGCFVWLAEDQLCVWRVQYAVQSTVLPDELGGKSTAKKHKTSHGK